MADLVSVRAKLSRADEHRQVFDRLLGRFLDEDPYSIAFEFDPDTGWHSFRWVVRHNPPLEDFALIEGDFLTNLRGALDYLAWQLVLAAGNQPTIRTAFPAVIKPQHWASAVGDRLAGIDSAWIAEIEKLQPYHRPQRPELHPLALIDHLNNINKHRTLPVTLMLAQEWRCTINTEPMPAGGQLRFDSFQDRPIEDGAEHFRFRWEQTRQQLDVDMDEAPFFRVAFSDGLNHDWTNDEAFHWVSRAIALFEPAFPS